MWVCARCRSNNELAACWRCGAPASEAAVPAAVPPPPPVAPSPSPLPADAAAPGYGAAAPWQAPAGYPPYPGWAVAPPARSGPGRRIALVLVAVAAAVVVIAVLTVVGRRTATLTTIVVGRQTATLTTPATIAGEGRMTNTPLESTTGTLAEALKGFGAGSTVVAVYGNGTPRHPVLAASGGLEASNDAFVRDVVAGAGTAGATIDASQLTHVTFGGAQYSCGVAAGASASMPFCAWWSSGDGGAVYSLPGASGDLL